MIYSVIGEHTDLPYPQRSLATLRSLVTKGSNSIVASLELLPADADEVVPAAFAYNLDHLAMCLHKIDRRLPEVGPVWLCGYTWANGEAWTTWSGHEERGTAERWLEAWKSSRVGGGRDTWEVREGSCPLDKFMPKGTKTTTVMSRLRS